MQSGVKSKAGSHRHNGKALNNYTNRLTIHMHATANSSSAWFVSCAYQTSMSACTSNTHGVPMKGHHPIRNHMTVQARSQAFTEGVWFVQGFTMVGWTVLEFCPPENIKQQ